MFDFETYSISTVSTSYPLFKFDFTTSNAMSKNYGYIKITYPAEFEPLSSGTDLKVTVDDTKASPDPAKFVQKFEKNNSSMNLIHNSSDRSVLIGNFMWSEEQSANKLTYALCRNSPVSIYVTGWKWKAGITPVTSITFSLKVTMVETID